jgi:hypothetical protein
MEIIANILGGIAGRLVGGLLALKAVKDGVRQLEEQEVRRLRVQCVVDIMGLRHILSDAPVHTGVSEDWARFTTAINKIPVLFADSTAILDSYREFVESQNNLFLIPLARRLLEHGHKQLTDGDLELCYYAVKKDT